MAAKRLLSLTAACLSAAILVGAARLAGDEPPAGELLPVLANGSPVYWKGNLHTHSLWSDGDDFPEMIADWYKRHGYHFLALSDHNVLSDGERWIDAAKREPALGKYRRRFGQGWVEERQSGDKRQVRLKPLAEFRSVLEEPGRFLMIPAEEITHRFAKSPVHINAVNLRDVVTPLDGGSVAEAIRVNHRAVAEQARRSGWRTLAFLNHPNFQWGIRAEDMILADELRYFEVYNGHPGVNNYGDDLHPGTERLWDIVLALRLGKHGLPGLFGLATDDAHGYHVFGVGKVNPGRGWIMVRAPHLSAEALLRAMEAGDFYASTGVRLKEVVRTGGRLSLVIEPEPGVRYRTQFIATMRSAPMDSVPRTDAAGKTLEVTRLYNEEIGKVVAETDSLTPSYAMTGKELYVRARITSSKPHPNPFRSGDTEMAWVQPLMTALGDTR